MIYQKERIFPDNVFKQEHFHYIFSWLSLVLGKRLDINFHQLLCAFLNKKGQMDYFLIPLYPDMQIISKLPVVQFSVEDNPAVYDQFVAHQRSLMNENPPRSFWNLPDRYLVCNKAMDWFFYDDWHLTLSLFALSSQTDVELLRETLYSFKDIFFCTSEDVEDALGYAYTEEGKAAFAKWIMPKALFLNK